MSMISEPKSAAPSANVIQMCNAIFVNQLKKLAADQRRKRRAVFNTFEYFQLIALLRQQHRISQYLNIDPDELDSWDDSKWTAVQLELNTYLKGLTRLQQTSTLPRLPSRDVDEHTAMLRQTFDEPAYGGILVDTIDGYADIIRPSSTVVDPLRRALYRWLPEHMVARDETDANLRRHYRQTGIESASPADLEPGPNDINSFVDGLARFMVALLGGAFLLVPIIVMSFTNSQNWRLVISSIAVVAFAVFLSFLSEASNQEVLGGAAAYAAVMVVFVGSALSTSTAS